MTPITSSAAAGDLLATLEAHFDIISGVHIGDAPTRQEPGTGEINFANLSKRLRHLGYDGEIGLEFTPSHDEATAMTAVRQLFPSRLTPRCKTAILGLDIGTSAIKAVLYDTEGNELHVEQRTYPLLTPRPGWVELDGE